MGTVCLAGEVCVPSRNSPTPLALPFPLAPPFLPRIDMDRADYMQRDAHMCGRIPLDVRFDRLIASTRVRQKAYGKERRGWVPVLQSTRQVALSCPGCQGERGSRDARQAGCREGLIVDPVRLTFSGGGPRIHDPRAVTSGGGELGTATAPRTAVWLLQCRRVSQAGSRTGGVRMKSSQRLS